MKSICVKTNNLNLIDYLMSELNYINLKQISIRKANFKHYNSVIVHYKGKDSEKFVHEVSCILACLVIDELEEALLKDFLLKEYFYFEKNELNEILQICFEIFADKYTYYFDKKYNLLINDFENYLKEHKSIILSGFLNFRINNYLCILNEVADEAVNQFLVQKEYSEFISLLNMYVKSQKTGTNSVHLIYTEGNSILFDENKNIIDIKKNIYNAKYLSDITFSTNDYILNTLLTLLPQKIYIHILNNNIDEFLHTLMLVFGTRIEICLESNLKFAKIAHKEK